MIASSFRVSLSILVLATSSAFGGCAAEPDPSDSRGEASGEDPSELLLDSAEVLSAESSASDPVEDAVLTDEDADLAADEAADQGDAPEPLDAGCGLRKTLRERLKEHFDKNGDGALDASERRDLKDLLDDVPRMRLNLVGLGLKVRHHVFRRIAWAYDVDGDGQLNDRERAALAKAVRARCEVRKERVLESHDANDDGQLDDGELRAAIQDRVAARVARAKELFGKADADGDGQLDEGERQAAREALRARYRARRDEVKAKYDANGDGILDDAEIAQLKVDIRARLENVAPVD
jgi:Ca2+-binding EF-hand superfamily protein